MSYKIPESNRFNDNRISEQIRIAIYITLLGGVLGLTIAQLGFSIEGASIAILSFSYLYYKLDRFLFTDFFFGPMTLIYAFHAMGYAVGPMWQIHLLGNLVPIKEGFIPAQWGSVIGLASFAFVYPLIFQYLSRYNTNRVDGEIYPQQKSIREYTIILWIIALSVISYGFISGVANRIAGKETFLQSAASIFSTFSSVPPVMFFFLGYTAAKRRGSWIFFWLFTFCVYSLFYFLDGGRGAAVYAALMSALGFVLAGVSKRKILLVGLSAFIIYIPIVDIVGTYRSSYITPTQVGFDARFQGIIQAVNEFSQERSGSIARSSENFIGAMTAQAVDKVFLLTPRYLPFVGLEGIDKIFYAFVPQIIQPNRPSLLDGNDLAIKYGASLPLTTGSYMPTVGDGYRRGGWLGICLLYAFSALLYGLLSALCWSRRNHIVWLAMFVYLIVQAPSIWSATLLSNFYLLFWMFPKNLIVFGLLRWIQTPLSRVFSLSY